MRRLIITAAIAASAIGAIAIPSVASAADCPSGSFCVNTGANFSGQQINHTGDDGWWESDIADNDESWANRGVTGPGVQSFVKVYEDAWQGGAVTICLPPGTTVNADGNAANRGDSHEWDISC